MKKSKLMKALLVFGMSMVTATAIVGFTACGDDHDHVDENGDGKCDVCETDMTEDGNGGTNLKVDVEKVELNKSELEMDIGDEETLQATVTPDTATDKAVNWSVSPAGVVTVVHGKVTAEAAGEATITATAGGKTATCTVKVNAPAPTPEVTEEEWAEILDSTDNFTYTAGYYEIKVVGNKVEILDELYPNNGHTNQIIVKDGESYDLYEQANDVWSKTTYSAEEAEEAGVSAPFNIYKSTLKAFKDDYNSFTYADGVYTSTETLDKTQSIGGTYENVVAEFDNGKLVEFKLNEGEIVNNVGSTTVDLPKIDGEDDPTVVTEVTAEQWAEILDSADNYTYTQTLPDMSTVNKVVGNKWQQTDGTGEVNQIIVKDGESYDVYVQDKDTKAWEKSTVSAEDAAQPMVESYNFALGILKVCKDDYKEFTPDDGKYIAETIDKTSTIGVTLQNVVAEFEDGKLIKVTFSDGNASYEINSVGSTEIELPQVGGGETDKVDVEKVELNKDELTLEVGGEETLTATVTPDNADDKTVTWTSSSPSVATVDDSGKVTAVAAGTATITATADGQSATCSVTVNDPDPGKVPNITEWGTVDNAVYNPAGGTIWHHIFLDDSTAKDYDFDSYEVTAVTVGGNASSVITSQPFDDNVGNTHTYHMHIQINGDKYQTTVFSISFKKDGKEVATGTYTREGDKEIVLDSYSEQLSVGSNVTINITSVNGSNEFADKQISWSIVDTEGTGIATIPDGSNGASVEVTAVAAGKATLTCTIGEGKDAFSKTCVITVVAGPVVIEAVDVSNNFVFNNKFTTTKDAIQVRCELNGKSEYANLITQIDPSQTTVTVTMDGEESTGKIIYKDWQSPGIYNLYVQIEVESNWDHDYAFTFSLKNSKGVEVAYGTYNQAGPAVLHLSKDKVNLRLTEDGSAVTEILKATKTAAAEGKIAWGIEDTEGEGVATLTANEDGTYTVTAVSAGTATITVTVGGLEKTCVVTVLGKDDTPPPSESDFEFECTKYYGDWWVEFKIISAPEGFTKASFDYVKVYRDNDEGKQEAAQYFADTNIFQVYCATAPKVYASEYKFEFIKGANVVATYYWTNDGKAPTV